MWLKFKEIFFIITEVCFNVILFIGYFCGIEFICKIINMNKIIGFILGISVAFITIYNIQREDVKQEKRNRKNEIQEKNKIYNFIKLIYENDYTNLSIIDSIRFNESSNETIILNLKNKDTLSTNVDNLLWITSKEQLIKLDKYIQKKIKEDSNYDKYLILYNITENKIDKYINM